MSRRPDRSLDTLVDRVRALGAFVDLAGTMYQPGGWTPPRR